MNYELLAKVEQFRALFEMTVYGIAEYLDNCEPEPEMIKNALNGLSDQLNGILTEAEKYENTSSTVS